MNSARGIILALASMVAAATLAIAPAVATAAPDLVVQSVETSRYPEIGLQVLLPADLPAGTPRFTVRENGVTRRVTLAADARTAQRKPIAVVLIVDTSGSMRGTPLDEAKRAADAFVGALRPDDEVAVVSFSDTPRVALGFTTDRGAIHGALEGLGAGGETAVYDSVILAEQTAASTSIGSRSLVLLSDGGDTASTASRSAMLDVVAKSRIPVYALGLQSPEADPALLGEIAKQSRGRTFSVADAASLTSAYGSVAREIQNAYTLTFASGLPNTKDLDIDVTAQVGSTVRRLALVVPNPALALSIPIGATGVTVTPMTAGIAGIAGVAIVVFASVTLFAFALMVFFAKPPTVLNQVHYYGDSAIGASTPPPADTVTARMLEAVGSAATSRGITAEVESRLARAGLPLRPLEYMFLHVAVVCVAGVVTQLVVASFFLSIAVVIVATIAPFVALDALATRRQRTFQDQLPQVLGLLAGSLRAGYGLLQGVELIVKEMTPPTSVEFGRVVTEARLGLPVETALEKMARRMGSEDFLWAVSAVSIQREVGGNLAEVLDIVATTIRERDALRRHISGLTSEGRLSAVILSVLPFAVLGAMLIVAPSYIGALFTNPAGMVVGAIAFVMLVVGLMWLRQIVRIEV